MGVYTICMGKGIIVSVKTFVKKYLNEINEIYDCSKSDEFEVSRQIVKKFIGEDFDVSCLGHDALETRDTLYQKHLIKEKKEKGEITSDNEEDRDLPFTSLAYGGDLMFIGFYRDLKDDEEFSHHVQAPEIIYGMARLIPDMIEYYPELMKLDTSRLDEIFTESEILPYGKSQIHTFTSDCCCCG